MIIWGGDDGNGLVNTGGVYDPATDMWTATGTAGAPSPRRGHTAVRMGSRMVVWGGLQSSYNALNTGGIYDPVSDTWTATTTVGAPSARDAHAAVWTGTKMIVWGGRIRGYDGYVERFATGGIYSPPDGTQGPLVAGTARVFPLVPQCGIPDGARSLSINLTVTQPTAAGHLRLYAAGTPLPVVSSINYSAGQTRANNAIATPSESGELAVWCSQASGTVHFILDVNGYFDAPGFFFTVTPCRLVDTRNP
jgi:hypothetical protein